MIVTGYKAIYVCVFSTRVRASSIVSNLSQQDLEKTQRMANLVYGQRSKLAQTGLCKQFGQFSDWSP